MAQPGYVHKEFPKWCEKDGRQFIVETEAEYLQHFPPAPSAPPAVVSASAAPPPAVEAPADVQPLPGPHDSSAAGLPDNGAGTPPADDTSSAAPPEPGNPLMGSSTPSAPPAGKPAKSRRK